MNTYYNHYSDDDLINIYDDLQCELSELDTADSDEYTSIIQELAYIEDEFAKRDI